MRDIYQGMRQTQRTPFVRPVAVSSDRTAEVHYVVVRLWPTAKTEPSPRPVSVTVECNAYYVIKPNSVTLINGNKMHSWEGLQDRYVV